MADKGQVMVTNGLGVGVCNVRLNMLIDFLGNG